MNNRLINTNTGEKIEEGKYILVGAYSSVAGNAHLSTDGGNSFQTISESQVPNSQWNHAAISQSGQYMMLTSANDARISSDYGVTWRSITDPWIRDCYGCSISATGQYMLLNVQNYVYRSTNYGVSWSYVWRNSNYNYDFYDCNISPDGSSYVAGGAYIAIRALSWGSPSSVYSSTTYCCSMSTTGQYINIGRNTSRNFSNNYGASFSGSYTPGFLRGLRCDRTTGAYVLGSDPTTIRRSTNYGTNWTTVISDSSADFKRVAVSFSGKYQAVADWDPYDRLLFSNDYGATFNQLPVANQYLWAVAIN